MSPAATQPYYAEAHLVLFIRLTFRPAPTLTMPLIVNCPNGCQIRIPINRSGRVVRCPKCKSAIRIPSFEKAFADLGQVVEVAAKLATKKQTSGASTNPIEPVSDQSLPQETETPPSQPKICVSEEAASSVPQLPTAPPEQVISNDQTNFGDTDIGNTDLEQLDPEIQRVVQSPPRVPPVMHSRPWRRVQPLTEAKPFGDAVSIDIEVPQPPISQTISATPAIDSDLATQNPASDPASNHGKESAAEHVECSQNGESESSDLLTDEVGAANESVSGIKPAAAASILDPPIEDLADVTEMASILTKPMASPEELETLPSKAAVTKPPVINLDIAPPSLESEVEKKSWEQRLQDANADRKMLTRFLAGCLLLVAIVNIVPAVYHWRSWALLAESMPLPRWIYLQIFIGAIYSTYAVFLMQINDWSALRSVSVAMLLIAFTFGIVSTGLLIGSSFSSLLGIPYSLNRQAGIWCVAMLILATIMSYWAGKESSNWRRAELLLQDILRQSN